MGHKSGFEICRALGFDPKTVCALTLRWSVGHPTTLTVERYVTGGAITALTSVLETYQLTQDEEATP